MKLSIAAELVYTFADAAQIIACLEASHTADQTILSESLDVQPPNQLLRDKSCRATAGSARVYQDKRRSVTRRSSKTT